MRRLQIFGFRETTGGASRDPEGRWTRRTPLPTDVPLGSLLDRHRLAWRLTELAGFLGLALVPVGFVGWSQQLLGGAGLAATLAVATATIAAAARCRRHVIRCPRCETHLMDFTDVYPLSFEARTRVIALDACPRCGRSLVDLEAGAAEDALRN